MSKTLRWGMRDVYPKRNGSGNHAPEKSGGAMGNIPNGAGVRVKRQEATAGMEEVKTGHTTTRHLNEAWAGRAGQARQA